MLLSTSLKEGQVEPNIPARLKSCDTIIDAMQYEPPFFRNDETYLP